MLQNGPSVPNSAPLATVAGISYDDSNTEGVPDAVVPQVLYRWKAHNHLVAVHGSVKSEYR